MPFNLTPASSRGPTPSTTWRPPASLTSRPRSRRARGRQGRFGKDDFDVDLGAGTVKCPAGQVVPIRFAPDGTGRADFAPACAACPLRERCTTSAAGRSVSIHHKEEVLQRHKAAQADPAWQKEYRSTRPKVRKIAPLFGSPGAGARR